MRIVFIGLVLLTGIKVWTQDRMYRSVMGDALIEAYRERAGEVCRKASQKRPVAAPARWDGDAQIVIGNPEVDVALWDTENPLWAQRYQHPNVVLTDAGNAARHCAYDVSEGTATLASH